MKTWIGQTVTFAIETDQDDSGKRAWGWRPTKFRDTIARIAADLGHPEDARRIADANGIRNIKGDLWISGHRQIKVPAYTGNALEVLAGDQPPRVTAGYAKLSTIDRPDRVGLTHFDGYDPVTLEVPIRFERYVDGQGHGPGLGCESDIALLERMAGRGQGATPVGPPPVVQVTTTDANGAVVALIPRSYQQTGQNPGGPRYRIAGIDWDPDALRNDNGDRIRQLATVTLQQHTRINIAQRSATTRSKTRSYSKPRRVTSTSSQRVTFT